MATFYMSSAQRMFIEGNDVSSLYVPRLGKVWERPYAYIVHNSAGVWYNNLEIPQWCNTVCFEMIGGGGGGQSGNGSNGNSGRPGGASTWVRKTYDLNRVDGETYTYQYYVGRGGDGGANSDHAAGKNGEMSQVIIHKTTSGGTTTYLATYTSHLIGYGGPDSGLAQGVASGAVASKPSVRSYIVLPGASGVPKETVGKSPGGGGGYGGGGYFGARGRGSAGGNGRIYAFFLADRV